MSFSFSTKIRGLTAQHLCTFRHFVYEGRQGEVKYFIPSN